MHHLKPKPCIHLQGFFYQAAWLSLYNEYNDMILSADPICLFTDRQLKRAVGSRRFATAYTSC